MTQLQHLLKGFGQLTDRLLAHLLVHSDQHLTLAGGTVLITILTTTSIYQRLTTIQSLLAGAGQLFILVGGVVDRIQLQFVDIHHHAADVINHLFELLKVYVNIVGDIHTKGLIDGFYGQLSVTVSPGVGQFFLAMSFNRHQTVTCQRGHLNFAVVAVDGKNDHRIGTALRAFLLIHTEQSDVMNIGHRLLDLIHIFRF